MFVKPGKFIDADGADLGALRVYDPDRLDHLPDEGREVPDNEYWARRVRDGDVEVADEN